jgi:hypothetical protein
LSFSNTNVVQWFVVTVMEVACRFQTVKKAFEPCHHAVYVVLISFRKYILCTHVVVHQLLLADLKVV